MMVSHSCVGVESYTWCSECGDFGTGNASVANQLEDDGIKSRFCTTPMQSFSAISLTLAGSWFFFGDTVVIFGETPSR